MKIEKDKILCLGEMLWDLLPSGPKPGGAPMNVALQLKRIGLNVQIASRVGNDELGSKLKSYLQSHDLTVDLVQVDSNLPTGEVIVTLDENGNAVYEICEPVAWDNLKYTDNLIQALSETGIVVYGTLASRNSVAQETILKVLDNEALKIIDVNLRPPFIQKEKLEILLMKADIIKLNNEELNHISSWYDRSDEDENKMIRWLSKKYNSSMVCVTKGEEGCVLYSNNQFYTHPGYKITTVDTVGAGDAFLAGFIFAMIQGKTHEEILNFSSATGAFVASKEGANPDYNMNEILQIMSQK